MFFGRFLIVETCCSPSSIKWKNIQYSELNRAVRSTLIWIMATIIVMLAFYGMVRFKDWNDELKAGAALDTNCPAEPFSVDIAFEDF